MADSKSGLYDLIFILKKVSNFVEMSLSDHLVFVAQIECAISRSFQSNCSFRTLQVIRSVVVWADAKYIESCKVSNMIEMSTV